MSAKRFTPGSVVATPGALEALRASGDDPLVLLQRHLRGDWGDVEARVERLTRALAPVILPMIDSLGALELEHVLAATSSGEAV